MAEEECFLRFVDLMPSMAEQMGARGLAEELCKGFRLLMDAERGVITLDSLKQNAGRLGVGEEEIMGMFEMGDFNGDGAMDQTEFCALMLCLSPDLLPRLRSN
ncbi:hypothetical protein HPP92_013647 [Vanilla planifolia]|uniref:EF-hand domain-containing protein n=1 Tax=Vanilla planifolia TaxID=51239 RepID=A0A835UZ15_VANPL|nr:hypothetical protein HPP92_014084 [Vanilla planifolia]KAG0478928.1 hypothetical protein HPP92_013647 [Vanilla planifolia]